MRARSRTRRPGPKPEHGVPKESRPILARPRATSTTFVGELAPSAFADVLLLRDVESARLLGMSVRTLHARVAAGLAPLPVRCGRLVRWRVDELRAWCAAGCPPRTAFDWPREAQERHP